MKELPLINGQLSIVPDQWFEELNKYEWRAMWSEDAKTFYAVRSERCADPTYTHRSERKLFRMHRVILDAPKGIRVDHVDHNGLNNDLSNIRLAYGNSNFHNKRLYVNNLSGFKGVYWHKQHEKWAAQIKCNRRTFHLGYFIDPVDAARAYNEAAIKYYGEFAVLNIIPLEFHFGSKLDSVT